MPSLASTEGNGIRRSIVLQSNSIRCQYRNQLIDATDRVLLSGATPEVRFQGIGRFKNEKHSYHAHTIDPRTSITGFGKFRWPFSEKYHANNSASIKIQSRKDFRSGVLMHHDRSPLIFTMVSEVVVLFATDFKWRDAPI